MAILEVNKTSRTSHDSKMVNQSELEKEIKAAGRSGLASVVHYCTFPCLFVRQFCNLDKILT